jgi:adenosine/AMP kinase
MEYEGYGECGNIIVSMELRAIRLEIPSDGNILVGQSHFIKTVEDIYEAIVNTVPQMKFGIAFNEASGACLTRVDGNDEELQATATRNASAVGAGHLFVVALRGGFPINVKNRILETPEVCTIFCATANPVEVIVAETEQGRGVLGVIDGSSPKGVETASDAEWRHGLVRKIGYKK